MRSWQVPAPPQVPGEASAPLQVFDTPTSALQRTGPESGQARMYVCGITPYDATHIGHANTYVTFDLLYRVWLDQGLDVHYVQNITDVDDPLLERAERDGVDWQDLAADQIELFRTDMVALNVLPPHDYLGATETIDEVVTLIERLRDLGTIYQVDDPQYPDWYFTTTDARGYADLAGLNTDVALELFAERGGDPERVGKRDPLDALVWRLARPGEPSWPSPLGQGRPGWHIECAAIALDRLGPAFDVQGGGSDLVFPHHEMSAAHAHTASGEPFAQRFVHSGMVGLDGEKMSKSKGNLVLVSQLRKAGVEPVAIRVALLAQHYRSDWSWSDDVLTTAQARVHQWRAAIAEGRGPVAQTIADVRAALRDDLDAPRALTVIDTWAEGSSDGGTPQDSAHLAAALNGLLGVDLGVN